MRGAFVYDEMFLEHISQSYHPERPERLAAVIRGLESAGAWDNGLMIPARPAEIGELCNVHEEDYVEYATETMRSGYGYLDSDTYFSPGSLDAAYNAAGGCVDLALAVHKREVDWGMAIHRPPGHHASWRSAAGFCIFNNIAVSVSSLIAKGLAKRVVIFDWDVHHGNGTQDQFWDNPDVLFISAHQYPFYPGSGSLREIGGDAARGKTINLPFPGRAVDGDYIYAMNKLVIPVLEAFKPDHLFVSAGFDAHEMDPLGGMSLTSRCYGEMAWMLKSVADRVCDGRLTFVLEGGYSLEALEDSAAAVVAGINGEIRSDSSDDEEDGERLQRTVVNRAIEIISPYWEGVFPGR